MKSVNFIIDPKKEYEYHQLFSKIPEFNSLSLFAYTSIKDQARIVRKIENFWDKKDRKIISEIENKWRTIEDEYFRLVEEVTGIPWLYDKYKAYFLAFSTVIGFSNPLNFKSQEIVLTLGANINSNFLIAHELFHSHYYYAVDKLKLKKKAINTLLIEGVAGLVLFKTDLSKLFSNTDMMTSVNSYSEVTKAWPKLVEAWKRRTSFSSFLHFI